MKTIVHAFAALVLAHHLPSASHPQNAAHEGDATDVTVIRRMERGGPWSEWELIKAARPRFPGHEQPKVPLWGYEDESDPRVIKKKIDAAADHGIDAFIFDWYCYEDGPFLDRTVNEGFLKAKNNGRIKFAFQPVGASARLAT